MSFRILLSKHFGYFDLRKDISFMLYCMFSQTYFSDCGDCLERYSSLRCHHLRSDLVFGLICSFLRRAALTYILHTASDGSEYISFFDGIGCSPKDKKSVGKCVVFLPGKAERRYSTTAADSCARYVTLALTHFFFRIFIYLCFQRS